MRLTTFALLLVRIALVWLLARFALNVLVFERNSAAAFAPMAGLAVACLVFASLLVAPLVAGVFGGHLGGFFGNALFYPENRFYEPPAELLRRLRLMIYDGQIGTAEHQLRGLLQSYPPHPVVYHLLALAQALRGQPPAHVLSEARAKLWPHQRAELFRLLQRDPLPAPEESEWVESAHVPGFFERANEQPISARPAPLRFTPAPIEPNEPPAANSAPAPKLKLTRSRPPEQPPGVAGK